MDICDPIYIVQTQTCPLATFLDLQADNRNGPAHHPIFSLHSMKYLVRGTFTPISQRLIYPSWMPVTLTQPVASASCSGVNAPKQSPASTVQMTLSFFRYFYTWWYSVTVEEFTLGALLSFLGFYTPIQCFAVPQGWSVRPL